MFVDALKAAVMTECPYSLLAEILFCFNDDAVKFLHIFAGRTIVVPSVDELTAQMRRVAIWCALKQVHSTDPKRYEEVVSSLAIRFRIKRSEVKDVYIGMQSLMETAGLELRPRGEKEDKVPA